MKYKAILLFLFSGLFLVPECKAFRPEDTTKAHNITTIFTEHSVAPFHQWQKLPWTVDTNLRDLQYYMPQYNLGNTGSPIVPVLFQPEINPLGFYYGDTHLESMLYSDSNIRYYNTRAPYVRLFYVTDPKIHQFVHFTFSMNVGKHFNFVLEFQRTRSQGVYINQGTNLNQLTLAGNYHSKHYVAFFDGMFGVHKINQNGGMVNDSNLGDATYSNRQTVAINLQQARSTFKDLSFHLKQYYFFGMRGDSTHKIPLLYVSHMLRVASNSNIFSDAGPLNTLYYPHIYKDSLLTYDSLHSNEITNDISLGSAKGWPSFLRWEAGVTDQWVHFINGQTDSIFSNLIAHAMVYDTGKFLYNIQGKEVFSGNQKGDYQASACVGYLLDSSRSVRVQGELASQTPALVYQLYYGNNLQWQNHYVNTNTSSASFIYCDTKWKLSVILQATQVQNLTYLNQLIFPTQDLDPINVFSVRLLKEFKLGKWHWNTNDVYQVVPDNTPIRLPQFVLENSVFYENWLFHRAMLFKVGVDVYYNTAYYGYGYMPIVNQYYLEDQTKLGNYVYLDPFVSFRVKTFRMFFRMENAGSGLIGSNYFYALHYPTTDRVFRLGISWDFWN